MFRIQGITVVRRISLLAVGVVLASCGTPEYRAERNVCASEWLTKIPPRYEQELYSVTESRRVPTGRTTCKEEGNTIICDQVMRTEYYSVPAIRTVDRNKRRRDAQISVCTQKACQVRFGNVECKA